MKFNKFLFCIVSAIALAQCPSHLSAQSIASGVPGGSSGIPNVPSTLATTINTNLPIASGNSIDMRVNKELVVDVAFNGSSAATNAAVTATYAYSLDGTTYDSGKTFALAVTGVGTTTARGSTNVDTKGYPYVIPISITNAIGVTVSNLTLRYATKNGS